VDRVEAKGLIVRTPVEGDRRARRLELTPTGRALIETAYRQHSAELRQWFSVLNATEQAQAFKALRKLSQHAARLPGKRTPG
jgi:DNA-binding MarR family transcriptional regulator